MKRILIIAASIIVVLGILVGIYFLFFTKDGAILSIDNPFDGLGGETTDVIINEQNLDPGEQLQGAGTVVAPRLIRITQGPVVPQTAAFRIEIPLDEPRPTEEGAFISTSTEQVFVPDTEIRYIERASGNIYSFVLGKRTLTRLGNKTLPGIQEASWVTDGSRAFVRYLNADRTSESVETYMLPATGEGGYFLEQNLSEVKVFGNNTLFTLLSSTAGSVGTVANVDGTNVRTLFTSPLSSLQFHVASSTYVAATKPSSGLDGYGFLVSPTNGTFTRILGPLRGLSVLPSVSGNQIVYSYVSQGAVRMSIVDRVTRSSTVLPLATLAEKCAWAADESAIYCAIPTSFGGNLPDDWYQGAVSFSDRLWRIDLVSRQAVLLIDPRETADVTIDAIGLTVDSAKDALTFVNRIDGSLWVYDL